MNRPNKYSKPLSGRRVGSYHPADYDGNQYADDLNVYIDYLENKDNFLPTAFILWYSGMEKEKVMNAYKRYLKEHGILGK